MEVGNEAYPPMQKQVRDKYGYILRSSTSGITNHKIYNKRHKNVMNHLLNFLDIDIFQIIVDELPKKTQLDIPIVTCFP